MTGCWWGISPSTVFSVVLHRCQLLKVGVCVMSVQWLYCVYLCFVYIGCAKKQRYNMHNALYTLRERMLQCNMHKRHADVTDYRGRNGTAIHALIMGWRLGTRLSFLLHLPHHKDVAPSTIDALTRDSYWLTWSVCNDDPIKGKHLWNTVESLLANHWSPTNK